MKRLLSAVAALAAFAFAAQAQVGPATITLGTNKLFSATTNTTAGTAFFVGSKDYIGVSLTAYSTNAAAIIGEGTTLLVQFQGSQDGSSWFNWGTNWDAQISMTTTNSKSELQVFDVRRAQWLRASEIRNAATNMVLFPSATYHWK